LAGNAYQLIWGIKAAGKQVEIRGLAVWCCADDKGGEISTLPDQFALLKQIGYLPEGDCAAWSKLAGRERPSATDGPRARACQARGPVSVMTGMTANDFTW
jgi:hypothetical protein